MIKLNLGSHNKDIGKEWINIDALDLPNVDLRTDLSVIPFDFIVAKQDKVKDWDHLFEEHLNGSKSFRLPESFVDEICLEEVLEHLSFRITRVVLTEIYRILKVGGKLRIQVPDCGKAMEAWVNKKVCDCVPHKPKGLEGFKGSKSCVNCGGKAIMDWQRWLFSFTGAQKHPFDVHKAIFTQDILDFEIRKAGFGEYNFKQHPVKLKVECIK